MIKQKWKRSDNMYVYFILNKKSGMFLGFTNDEKLVELFLKKRGKKHYKVKKIKKNKLHKSCIKQLNDFSSYDLICFDDNIPVFEYEEEAFAEAFHQFLIDLESSIKDLKEIVKFFNFGNDEKDKVKKAIKKFIGILEIIMEEDYGIEESEFTYLDREKMVMEFIERHY